MLKNIFIPGMLGAFVFVLWTIILNVFFGFSSRIMMRQVPNEQAVYEMLKANITEPGIYLCNPALTPDWKYPDNEPVFGIRYAGVGHEWAGSGEFLDLLILLIAPVIAAWMLSVTSERFKSSYANRVLFFTSIGFLIAVFSDLKGFGIGGYALSQALILSARTIIAWTVVGLAVAWRMHPRYFVTQNPPGT